MGQVHIGIPYDDERDRIKKIKSLELELRSIRRKGLIEVDRKKRCIYCRYYEVDSDC